MIGRRLGGFEIVEEIGRGGTFVVYKARQLSLDREVALKVLSPDVKLGESLLAEFQAQARASSRLSHPNLAQVYDVGQQAGTHYVAMELVVGEDVAAIVKRLGPMDYLQIAVVASQAAAGLAALEEARMVHGAVKPSNVLIRQDSSVSLTDFGFLALGGRDRSHLNAEFAASEARYWAPERALEGTRDARSDIYSLGVVMYQMLTAQAPFEGETAEAALQKHIEEQPPSLRRFRPDVPDSLAQIVARCLAKGPGERYQTAQALAIDLNEARLGLEFEALSSDTPFGDTPSLYSTQTVLALRRQRTAQDGLLKGALRHVRTALAATFDYASQPMVGDVPTLRRVASRMEKTLEALAEAKHKRADLRKKAAEARGRAERTRNRLTAAFDSEELAGVDELQEEEKRFDEAAVDFEAASEAWKETIVTLEERFKKRQRQHEQLSRKVQLEQAWAAQDVGAQRAAAKWQKVILVAFLALLLLAVGAWRHVLRRESWGNAPGGPAWTIPKSRPPQRPAQSLPTPVAAPTVPNTLAEAANGGLTALHRAAAEGQTEIVEQLLDAGAEIERRDDAGQTPLHHAVRSERAQTVALLLARGAEVDAEDGNGYTPMHRSASEGSATIAEILLKNGANVNASLDDGRTPLALASEKGHQEVIEILRKHGDGE